MREYAWYCPELNIITLQTIMIDCYICFEWGINDMYDLTELHGTEIEPMNLYTWTPLGEI